MRYVQHQARAALGMLLLQALLLSTGRAAPMEVQWLNTYGGPRGESASQIAVHSNGNISAAGLFGSSNITFGDTNLSLVTPNSEISHHNIVLLHFNAAGEQLWARQITALFGPSGVAALPDGSVLLSGRSQTNFSVAGREVAASSDSGFVIKFLPDGGVDWVQPLPEPCYTQHNGMGSDSEGSAYVIYGFGQIPMGQVPEGTARDAHVVKLSPTGEEQWSRVFTGAGSANARAIAVAEDGSSVVTGSFDGEIDFEGTALTAETGDIFTALLDANGRVIWVKQGGGERLDEGLGVAIDEMKNVYVTGYFFSTEARFGPHSAYNSDPTTLRYFLCAYSPTGETRWVRQGFGGSFNGGVSMALTHGQRINVYGEFRGPELLLDYQTLKKQPGNATSADLFLASYTQSGVLAGACQFRGTLRTGAIAAAAGDLLLTGGYGGTFDGGAADSGGVVKTSKGLVDMFIARVSVPDGDGPLLNLNRSGNHMVLSWMSEANGFLLEQSQGLGGAWERVAGGITRVGTENVATFEPGEGTKLFRLRAE